MMEVNSDYEYEDDVEDRSFLQQIFKKFLIGSKMCKKVEVIDCDQLEILVEVALNYPLSLQQLCSVQTGTYLAISLLYADDLPDVDDIFDTSFKVEKSAPITDVLLISTNFYFPVFLRADDLLSQTGDNSHSTAQRFLQSSARESLHGYHQSH
jgi:hypothetical protein